MGTERDTMTATSAARSSKSDEQNELGLISIRRAAAILTVSPNTVRQLVRDGMIPHCVIGTVVRVRESDVRTYIDRQLTA